MTAAYRQLKSTETREEVNMAMLARKGGEAKLLLYTADTIVSRTRCSPPWVDAERHYKFSHPSVCTSHASSHASPPLLDVLLVCACSLGTDRRTAQPLSVSTISTQENTMQTKANV